MKGEGIYSTRTFTYQVDGFVDFNYSKNLQYVYAIIKERLAQEPHMKRINPGKGGKIEMLGYNNSNEWTSSNEGVIVKLPVQLQIEKSMPCDH
ncbi:MAG: hypothetical protein WCR20_02715 [Verrucomicrobiota bacterium]